VEITSIAGGEREFGLGRCRHRCRAVYRDNGQNQPGGRKSHENRGMHGYLLGVHAAGWHGG
jgi:hypothetical protein